MAKRHKCPEHVNHERWLVSYADFITLLFAFFTVLYAISNTDAKKVEKFVGSAERAFSVGVFPSGSQTIMLGDATTSSGGGVYDLGIKITDVENNLKDSMAKEAEAGRVSVERKEGGLLITLKTYGFFEQGSDELNPHAFEIISKISEELRRIPNEIRVEGHTDNLPIKSTRFPTNWDLSSARSVAVLKGLLLSGIDPARLSVAGYAEFRPLTSNKTSSGRAMNRRVELFVVDIPKTPAKYMMMAPKMPLEEEKPHESEKR